MTAHFFIENCADVFKNQFINEKFDELSIIKKLKVSLYRFENLPISSNSYKNNILKGFHS